MITDMLTIYHNPRCGKSRQTLKIIHDSGQSANVVEYLKVSPDFDTLKGLSEKLGMAPQELIRKGESIFKERYKGVSLTDDEWIQAMVEYPILIERPIVVKDNKAVLGRPPENVNELL
jgi:arsenate reductase